MHWFWLVASGLYIDFLCWVTMATDLILLKPGCACDLFGKQQMREDGSFWASEALPPVEFSLGLERLLLRSTPSVCNTELSQTSLEDGVQC